MSDADPTPPMWRGGPLDLDVLERLAGEASPGPWESWIEGRDHTSGDSFVRTARDDLHPVIEVQGREWNENWKADQDFIAAANPKTILELIRLLRSGLGS